MNDGEFWELGHVANGELQGELASLELIPTPKAGTLGDGLGDHQSFGWLNARSPRARAVSDRLCMRGP